MRGHNPHLFIAKKIVRVHTRRAKHVGVTDSFIVLKIFTKLSQQPYDSKLTTGTIENYIPMKVSLNIPIT